MGQKVDPRGIRLGITRTWDSKWFAEGKEYVDNFHEDLKIKKYIKKKLLPCRDFFYSNRKNIAYRSSSYYRNWKSWNFNW